MKHLSLKKRFKFCLFFLPVLITINSCSKQQTVPQKYTGTDPGKLDKVTTLGDFAPTSGVGGTVVKFAGKNFNPVLGNNSVFINGDALTIYSVTPTEIVAAVPPKANSGIFTMYSGSTPLASRASFTVTYGYLSNYIKVYVVYPQHIAIDRKNVIFGHNDQSVFKINPDGTNSMLIAPNDDYKHIADLTIRPSGDIYLANAGNFNIVKLSQTGATTVFAGAGTKGYANGTGTDAKFSAIGNICHDEVGNLYVIDGHRIRKITTTGAVSTLAGSDTDGNIDGVGEAAQFGTLAGIAVNEWEGTVYVSDQKYHNIRKIEPDGSVTTLAGNGTAGFADGTGTAAQFYQPGAMAVDPSGNIWIVDSNPAASVYEVREMNKAGLVYTFVKGTTDDGEPLTGSAYAASVVNPQSLVFDLAGSLYIDNYGANTISKMIFH